MDRAKLFRESASRANEGRDRNGWRYTAALRRLAVEYCHSCRRSHQRFSEIADSLGVSIETRIGRFDINPADPHVQQRGPHLNLETQTDGTVIGRDPHLPIDPSTIRPGDHP